MHSEVQSVIEQALSKRPLLFCGSRSVNALPLLDRGWLDSILSLSAPLKEPGVYQLCLEQLTGLRVDGNTYSLDSVYESSITEYTSVLEDRLKQPSTIVIFRPTYLIETIITANHVDSLVLANPAAMQTAFEYKPWVESSIGRLGVRTIPWKTFLAHELRACFHTLQFPFVARASRSEGGSHVWLMQDPGDLSELDGLPPSAHISVSPLLSPSVSINIHAVVYASGNVSLHPPSFQILGDPLLTNWRFGYCGNDFGAVRNLDAEVLIESEIIVRAVGKWLCKWGYLGVFGVDLLIHDGIVYFVELNARFQGSSVLADQLDQQMGRPGVFAMHLAAFLGFDGSDDLALDVLVKNQPVAAFTNQLNTDNQPTLWLGWSDETDTQNVLAVPDAHTAVAPSAIMYQVIFDSEIADANGAIKPSARKRLKSLADRRDLKPLDAETAHESQENLAKN
jgi:hypothetical protein